MHVYEVKLLAEEQSAERGSRADTRTETFVSMVLRREHSDCVKVSPIWSFVSLINYCYHSDWIISRIR